MKKMTKAETTKTAKLIEQTINDEELEKLLLDAGEKYYDFVFNGGDSVKGAKELENRLRRMMLDDDMCRFMDRVIYKGKFSGTEKAWLRFYNVVVSDPIGGEGEMFNVFALFYKMAKDFCSFLDKFAPLMG